MLARDIELGEGLDRAGSGEAAVIGEVAGDQILQRGADQEVLLAQAKLAAGLGRVVGVQDPVDPLGGLLGRGRGRVVAPGQGREVDRLARRFSAGWVALATLPFAAFNWAWNGLGSTWPANSFARAMWPRFSSRQVCPPSLAQGAGSM